METASARLERPLLTGNIIAHKTNAIEPEQARNDRHRPPRRRSLGTISRLPFLAMGLGSPVFLINGRSAVLWGSLVVLSLRGDRRRTVAIYGLFTGYLRVIQDFLGNGVAVVFRAL